MLTSPFAYYRGAALPMAADLAGTRSSGLQVQLCGDAHLLNFGAFASPERRLVFDLNDFDETLPGPFEWDVKRLVASMAVAAEKIDILAREYSQGHVYRLDGISAEFDDWHFNVRQSNTEPLLRLNLEGLTPDIMERSRDEVLGIIRG